MRCAYCHQEKKLTREHVIPESFLKKTNISEMKTWMDHAPNKFINSDIVVKDVCSQCNNGILSELDAYAIELIVSYNKQISINTQDLLFKYDFNKLSRWLLKVCFNSARANKCKDDADLYSSLINFIMDNSIPKSKVLIYASLIELDYKINNYYHLSDDSYEIDYFRICPFRLKNTDSYKCATRIIMINSFAFIILVFDKSYNHETNNLLIELNKTLPMFVKLSAKNSTILKKDKTLWGTSLVSHSVLNAEYFGKSTIAPSNKEKTNLIEIRRESIETLDFLDIDLILAGFKETRPIALSYMQKVEIFISGYDDDHRGLYQIKEVQKYIKILLDKHPYLIFYLDLSLNFIKVMLYAYINDDSITDTLNDSRNINISQIKWEEFITKSFMGLNRLTNSLVLDDSINREISLKFNNLLMIVAGNNDY